MVLSKYGVSELILEAVLVVTMVVRCAAYAFDFVKMSKNTDAFLKLKMRQNSFLAGTLPQAP